jgi:hypothetical protein
MNALRVDWSKVLTTGQIARMCNVAPRTVSKWCDERGLRHHKHAVSGDRRVRRADLVAYLQRTGWPVPPELSPVVLTFGLRHGEAVPGGVACRDAVEAGAVIATQVVAAAVVGDADGLGVALAACRGVRERHPGARVVLVVAEDVDPAGVDRRWCGEVVGRPADWPAVVAGLDLESLGVVNGQFARE